MLPRAWDLQLLEEQMMDFGWLLMVIVGIAVALLILLAAVLGMLERIKDEATSKLNPNQEPSVHVLNRQQREAANV
jgi:hypothetical protein